MSFIRYYGLLTCCLVATTHAGRFWSVNPPPFQHCRQSAELEERAKKQAGTGAFVELRGHAISGEDGAVDMKTVSEKEAKDIVQGSSDYYGYLSIDDDPDAYPKFMAKYGHGSPYAPRNRQPCTLHLWRPAGSLPIASAARLFHDGLELARKCTPRVLRPGRAEGLGDENLDKLCLFAKKVSPEALRQGELGNCWLVSALSAAAEYPEILKALFEQTTLSMSGKYNVRLFHPVEDRWVSYELDDRLPVNQYGSLRNVQLSAAGELWPALLEKAMAAMFGGEQPRWMESPSYTIPPLLPALRSTYSTSSLFFARAILPAAILPPTIRLTCSNSHPPAGRLR